MNREGASKRSTSRPAFLSAGATITPMAQVERLGVISTLPLLFILTLTDSFPLRCLYPLLHASLAAPPSALLPALLLIR